ADDHHPEHRPLVGGRPPLDRLPPTLIDALLCVAKHRSHPPYTGRQSSPRCPSVTVGPPASQVSLHCMAPLQPCVPEDETSRLRCFAYAPLHQHPLRPPWRFMHTVSSAK